MAFKQLKLWFDKELAKMLADKIIDHKSDFKVKKFISHIDKGVQDLELKDRVEYIADALHQFIGTDYKTTISLLLKTLGPENEEETGMFKKYYWIMPIAKYVEKYGLNDFKISMKAIEEITKRNTSEYTIRPFIEQAPDKTLKVILKWSKNKNKHIRRLASEGVRPKLPWATKLQLFIDDPKPILPILENLKDDPSKYVQKSVANCLNDILKDNFKIGKKVIETWSKKPSKERAWIIKHALRNFRKKGDKWALDLVGRLH